MSNRKSLVRIGLVLLRGLQFLILTVGKNMFVGSTLCHWKGFCSIWEGHGGRALNFDHTNQPMPSKIWVWLICGFHPFLFFFFPGSLAPLQWVPQLGALLQFLFFGGRSPTKIDYRKKLVPLFYPLYWRTCYNRISSKEKTKYFCIGVTVARKVLL